MNNQDIRKAIETNNFKYWQVANKLGMTDGNFSRMLRIELTKENKERVLNAINELKEEREKWNKKKSYIQKKDVIENYKPMFTEWSLSKLIREGKIKYIRVGRRIFITKQAVDEFIKEQQESSLRGNFHIL